MITTAHRASTFTESVIREMTRVSNQYGAINLAQGFPDFPMPGPMKEAACAAIQGDINQYAITWGTPALRLAIAAKYKFTDGELCDHYRSPIGSRRDLGLFQVNFYGFVQEFILQEIGGTETR